MRHIFLIAVIFTILVGFQNCGRFSANSNLNSLKSVIVSATTCLDCIRFEVSAPQTVLQPTGDVQILSLPDNLFTTVSVAGRLLGFLASGWGTFTVSGTTLADLNQLSFNSSAILTHGDQGADTIPYINAGQVSLDVSTSFILSPTLGANRDLDKFDACGSWIHGADYDSSTNSLVVWYHGEHGYCRYDYVHTPNQWIGDTTNNPIIKSIGYAISTDGGQTFTKPSYPNNLVLSAPDAEISATLNAHQTGNGDFSVVRRGDFYYIFFLNSGTGETGVAQSPVTAKGAPGTWLKWHNGAFSEPGIGGLFSPIGPTLAGVSYNTSLNQFVGLTYPPADGSDVGFQVALSSDGVTWITLKAPLIPTGMRWADGSNGTDSSGNPNSLYGATIYHSIIGSDGSKNWSDSFSIYYNYTRPGDSDGHRFLLTSKVTMIVDSTAVIGPRVSTELAQYLSSSRNRHWTTSGFAVPTQESTWDFQYQSHIGGVFTMAGDGLVEIDDCYYSVGATVSHYIGGGPNCDNNTGATKARTIGWIYSPSGTQPPNTHPIYNCYNGQTGDFVLASAADGCLAQYVSQGLLGYVMN